jgi:hypothetical protein
MTAHPRRAETHGVTTTRYRIVVKGRLSERFVSNLEGVSLERAAAETSLIGDFRDQSELYGMLDRLRGLGVELVSLGAVR